MSEIRQTERRTAPAPGRNGRRRVRPPIAAAIGALALGAFAVVGGAIWLAGESGRDAEGVAVTNPSTTQASSTSAGREATGINAVLAVHSVRAVTAESTATIVSSEDGKSFPYLVLEVPGSEMRGTRLSQAYEVLDPRTDQVVGVQTVYQQWWTTSAGDIAQREILLRVQDVGQDYEWLSYLTELAESSRSVRIGDRDVTVYRIPDENIEEGSYDLDVLYWVEESGVEGILIPWGLSGEEATGLMTGLRKLTWEEWQEWLAIAPGPEVSATTSTVVEGG